MSFDTSPHIKPLPLILSGPFIAPMLVFLAMTTWGITGCTTQKEWHSNCTIQDKFYSPGQNRVKTSCGTFSVQDSYAAGNKSFDTYTALKLNGRYDIQTEGNRDGNSSTFPNVIDFRVKG